MTVDATITLREHIESLIVAMGTRFDALRAADELRYQQLRAGDELALRAALTSAEKAVQTALNAAKEAVVKAEIATEKRLEGLNELRQGVATKDALDALDMRLQDLKESVTQIHASQVGRASGLKDYVGWIVAAVTIISALVGFALLLRK
jgi:hypothetical protein